MKTLIVFLCLAASCNAGIFSLTNIVNLELEPGQQNYGFVILDNPQAKLHSIRLFLKHETTFDLFTIETDYKYYEWAIADPYSETLTQEEPFIVSLNGGIGFEHENPAGIAFNFTERPFSRVITLGFRQLKADPIKIERLSVYTMVPEPTTTVLLVLALGIILLKRS